MALRGKKPQPCTFFNFSARNTSFASYAYIRLNNAHIVYADLMIIPTSVLVFLRTCGRPFRCPSVDRRGYPISPTSRIPSCTLSRFPRRTQENSHTHIYIYTQGLRRRGPTPHGLRARQSTIARTTSSYVPKTRKCASFNTMFMSSVLLLHAASRIAGKCLHNETDTVLVQSRCLYAYLVPLDHHV